MITPWLAIPGAAGAISNGVAAPSCWPMADLASAGLSRAKALGSGNTDCAPKGRSMGGTLLNPNWLAPLARVWAPMSRPSWAKAVLHEIRRISGSGPPQAEPPKLRRGSTLWGRGSSVSVGYTGWVRVAAPEARAAAAVTTLKLDPGK